MKLNDLLTQITPLETDSEQPLTKAYVKHASTLFPELVKALEDCQNTIKSLTENYDLKESYLNADKLLARANEIKI